MKRLKSWLAEPPNLVVIVAWVAATIIFFVACINAARADALPSDIVEGPTNFEAALACYKQRAEWMLRLSPTYVQCLKTPIGTNGKALRVRDILRRKL